MKIQTSPTQSFLEHAPSFNYRISMDTKGPINPPSHNKSYIHVIIDAFSHFVVTVPIQVHIDAYAHNSQPFSELSISPHEIVFHTRPRIPLTFDLNLNRDTSKTCISRYCSQLPEHSHYDKSDLNPVFYRTLSKAIPHWFLAVETAMLQIYSTVYVTAA